MVAFPEAVRVSHRVLALEFCETLDEDLACY
jgi:hypothetical protein